MCGSFGANRFSRRCRRYGNGGQEERKATRVARMAQQHRTDHLLDRVGPRLRATRTARGLTLADVSEGTGISRSTLSRLESGKRRPSLDLLLPLAELFRVSLDDLVGSPGTGDPRIDIRPLTRGGVVHLDLGGEGPVSAHKTVIPGTRRPHDRVPDMRSHPGREWIYVLAGTLRLVLDGHEYTVEPGESAEFDCTLPHWFGAGGPQAVEYLGLSSRSGERVHLNATVPDPSESA